jgi:CHAD domain-containing protein
LDELRSLVAIEAPTPDQVHTIRTHIKKLRSWLRLMTSISRDDYSSPDTLLKIITDSYAAAREIHVMLKTLARLEAACTDSLVACNCREIMVTLPLQDKFINARLDNGTIFRQLELEIPELLPDALTAIPLALAISAQQAGRRLKRRKFLKGNQEALHDFRKRLKRLDYQLQTTGVDADPGIRARHSLLADMTDTLGDLHDLEVLRQWLQNEDHHPGRTTDLLQFLGNLIEIETRPALDKADELSRAGVLAMFS